MTHDDGFREGPTGQLQFARIAGIVPDRSHFSISGKLTSRDHEFNVGDQMMVSIVGADGEVVASQHYEVTSVGATQKRDKDGFVIERARVHKLKS